VRKPSKPSPTASPLLFEVDPEPLPETLTALEGVPLECVAGDHWKIELEAAGRPVAFKLLINDEQWNCGPDYTVEAGAVATVDPKF